MAIITSIKNKACSLFGCLENTVKIKEDNVEGIGEDWKLDVNYLKI